MSRFLICTVPVAGHVNPGLPIARALVERGHEVRWYTGQRFRSSVEATGARYLPMDAVLDYDAENLDRSYPGRHGLTGLAQMKWDLKHIFLDAIPAQVAALRRILREFPADVVLADPGFYGAGSLLGASDPPYATYGISALTLTSRDTAPFGTALPPDSSPLGRVRNWALAALFRRILFRDVNAHSNRVHAGLGLPPFSGSALDAFSPYLYLQSSTPAFEYPRSDLPPQVHFIGPLLPEAPRDFAPPDWWPDLRAGQPVVLVNQGTVATDVNNLILPTLRALADQDVLVVATTGGASADAIARAWASAAAAERSAAETQIVLNAEPMGGLVRAYSVPRQAGTGRRDGSSPATLPANARIAPFIPFGALLPHVDVMITNGGYGGVQFALAHGVPLIVAGATEEKPEIAARVAWSGAGINLRTNTPTPEQIRTAVDTMLLNHAHRRQAERIRADYARHNAPHEAAALLERLAATRRPVRRDDVALPPATLQPAEPAGELVEAH